MKQPGWSQRRIAEALGVTPGAVSQWMRRQREGGGIAALDRRPPPGLAPKLTGGQRTAIPLLLARGAEAYGFTEPAAAPDPRDAAGRGGHPRLVHHRVVGAFSKARLEQRTVLFGDESAFYLLPSVVRTYAPRGQTLTLRVPLTRDHLSAISAITPEGRLFLRVRQGVGCWPEIRL